MTPAIKKQAVLKVFPTLDRNGLSNEEAAVKIKQETGIDVKPGYIKHVLRGARAAKDKKKAEVSQNKLEEVKDAAKQEASEKFLKERGATLVVKDVRALADKVGGLNKLYELIGTLIDLK